ncbi:hypothetical protein XENTR_v10020815 [Xenopus tropicalis]|nr:hypothetical protein XENTR_v10020815 [Xenopus tropicalis]
MKEPFVFGQSVLNWGLLLRSLIWLCAPDFLSSQESWFPRAVCVLISTWILYFYSVLFWAFFCFSLEVAQLFSPNPERFRKLYAFVCWGAPSLLWLHGLLILVLPNTPEDSCDSKQGLVLFHDILVYVPFMLALLGSPLILRHAITKVPVVLRMRCGIYTSSERFREHNLCRRFFQICSAFITCRDLWGHRASPTDADGSFDNMGDYGYNEPHVLLPSFFGFS